MQVTLAHIGAKYAATDPYQILTDRYLKRSTLFSRCQTEAFKTEEAFLEWMDRQHGRTPIVSVLLDSRGKQMTSEAFAAWIGMHSDRGVQHMAFAIGPASGWSEHSKSRAKLLLSLGSYTLAHALARLVLAEQLYRACTILTGHPYHTGH